MMEVERTELELATEAVVVRAKGTGRQARKELRQSMTRCGFGFVLVHFFFFLFLGHVSCCWFLFLFFLTIDLVHKITHMLPFPPLAMASHQILSVFRVGAAAGCCPVAS